jgi:hypothetical protein
MSQSLVDLVDLAYTSVDSVFRQWADGFVITAAVAEGVRLFEGAGRNFNRMVGDMKSRLASGRMSVESVNSVVVVERWVLAQLSVSHYFWSDFFQ